MGVFMIFSTFSTIIQVNLEQNFGKADKWKYIINIIIIIAMIKKYQYQC